MSRRARHLKTTRLRMTPAGAAEIAAAVVDGHEGLLAAGWTLVHPACGLWQVPTGTLTVRMVYQRGAYATHVVTIRHVQLDGSAP